MIRSAAIYGSPKQVVFYVCEKVRFEVTRCTLLLQIAPFRKTDSFPKSLSVK